MAFNTSKFLSATAMVVVATSLLAPTAKAQQVYRIVGPDGKVSFSDQPPPASSNAKATSSAVSASSGSATIALPFELRQVVNKYPVTLYTSANCGPCGTARALLGSRGVPFNEKTIASLEDVKALQRLSGDTSLPFATIGGQQLNGFSDTEWTQFLNAAGYPTVSKLPASYRQPAATPLVAVAAAPSGEPAAAASAAASARPARPSAATPPTAAPANNPAGIKF